MGNEKPWLNGSGCHDPTAYEAIKKMQSEDQTDHIAQTVIATIRNVVFLSGFELVGRIQIRHKRSGKIYK